MTDIQDTESDGVQFADYLSDDIDDRSDWAVSFDHMTVPIFDIRALDGGLSITVPVEKVYGPVNLSTDQVYTVKTPLEVFDGVLKNVHLEEGYPSFYIRPVSDETCPVDDPPMWERDVKTAAEGATAEDRAVEEERKASQCATTETGNTQ